MTYGLQRLTLAAGEYKPKNRKEGLIENSLPPKTRPKV